ncbi:MAG: fimbria major subunit, partial [Muribaculaceae bacterium]|nr:fimbria major subunit [Muribaculaceae bacterium]
TLIELDLSVDHTRATNDTYATAAEKAIKKVNIYIFGDDSTLEQTELNQAYSDGAKLKFEVASGNKTIFVTTAGSIVTPADGISLADFEKLAFSATNSDLNTSDGFVMTGKSTTQFVAKSATAAEMPASNSFSINLTRAIAKAQVRCNSTAMTQCLDYGFRGCVPVTFRICQSNKNMLITHQGTDLVTRYTDADKDGCYDNYSVYAQDSFIDCLKSGNFKSDGCQYMSENIVANPLSGNTTFISLKLRHSPQYFYDFTDGAPKKRATTSDADGPTFYVVGLSDRANGFIDYTVDTANHVIISFENESDANAYCTALNGGELSAMTVSETEQTLSAPRKTRAGASAFEVFKFENGAAYYRINIAHTDASDETQKTYKVVRNNFYKVDIKNIKTLGLPSEEMLRPLNADMKPDTKASAWLETTLNVENWDQTSQDVDL